MVQDIRDAESLSSKRVRILGKYEDEILLAAKLGDVRSARLQVLVVVELEESFDSKVLIALIAERGSQIEGVQIYRVIVGLTGRER